MTCSPDRHDPATRAHDAGALVSAGRFVPALPIRPGPLRTHGGLVLLVCTAGRGAYESDARYQLEAGDVVVLPAGAPHRLVEAHDLELWGVLLCPSCWAALEARGAVNGSWREPFERVQRGAAAVCHVPPERRALVGTLVAELSSLSSLADARAAKIHAGDEEACAALVTLLLREVCRAQGTGLVPQGGAADWVGAALRYIDAHCLAPLSLAEVAAAVGRSPSHVTTTVRRSTGKSVQAWIIEGRLAEARRRLRSTDEHIDIVAERVGYADATHFIRLFRRASGETPQAWRRRHRAASA